jgi:hypothetical protein
MTTFDTGARAKRARRSGDARSIDGAFGKETDGGVLTR